MHNSSSIVSIRRIGSGRKDRLRAVFSCPLALTAHREPRLKTAVYVDGYNFYYGRIRGSAYKWLDLVALFEQILHVQDPAFELKVVQYFTAPALPRFASHGMASEIAQSAYIRALQARHGDRFTVTLGEHSYSRNGVAMPAYIDGQPFDRTQRVRVWRLEEKKTDVNLALAIYRDAAAERFDQVVVATNDRDVEPALQALREDFPKMAIGVITPARPAGSDEAVGPRRVSTSLARHADWTRQHIRDEELAAAQLPKKVSPPGKKAIVKPDHW